ncbi:TatD family hydrolase [Aquaticitalea lipolytica]|uniref:TatD family hydrolase n=1 Tax=Aquaticitalea lipolytica TaxID=1247562 RepID=A0A8J2XFN5_9FLAO|nr:Qat anti-phage system TatD family nuclease QatD [Aquaticitalea lipolytica]GFZ79807.1 TatD family hydrolase [Aquaticitalea lipolytica]
MRYHDTHFHLDLMPNPEGIAEKIEQNKVYTIAVTNSPTVFFYTEKISLNKRFLRPALGLHPELAFERQNEIDQFIKLLPKAKYIGEIGLDNFKKSPENFKTQKLVFEKIIEACDKEGGKILTIHSRKAEKEVLNIIGDKFSGKIILHWYSGSLRELDRAISIGAYFSINHSMTKSKNGQKIIERIPLNKLLIETDGPFTSLNSKPFIPTSVDIILDSLVRLKSNHENSDIVRERILKNFYDLINVN